MDKEKPIIHPYIPNSLPEIKAEMLRRIGVNDIEELFQAIPEDLRFKEKLKLPKPYLSEYELKRHVLSILSKNKTCEGNLNFLGGGCWQHYVPAICDEINGRSEFLTAYGGTSFNNLGRFQAHFEFQSQMGELLDMDVVSVPTYSWGTAAGYAIRMAKRLTQRNEVLISKTINPEHLAVIKTFCSSATATNRIEIKMIDYNTRTGLTNLHDLRSKVSSNTAGIYFENPTYLGTIESQGQEISDIAHTYGGISLVGVDPITLGVLKPPTHYGADIVVGTAQTLGIHMNCGGGTIGFIASRDEEQYIAEYPLFLYSITDTIEEGEYGFGNCTFERTSYVGREKAKDWVGTVSGLWAITAAVYMALMGPQGFRDIGRSIIRRSHYAIKLLSEIKGVKVLLGDQFFKEFVVNFDGANRTVRTVNDALLDYNIFGGKDLSSEFPELGNSALYCITEMHTEEDINKLVYSLKKVLEKWKKISN
jgi:glycine dehydrogenase subunit 1